MGGPEAGPYLRELSDETSRSESSVSLGGGGGSLSGTAGKAGDFLEKNTSYHLGAGRTLVRLALPPSASLSGEWHLGRGRRTTERGWVPGEGVGRGPVGEPSLLYLEDLGRLRVQKYLK